jgi:hypothetical protein
VAQFLQLAVTVLQ